MDSQFEAKNRLKEIVSTQEGIALCWLGNLGWLLCADGLLVATDLDLEREGRIQPSPIPTAEIAPLLDVHLITHEHEDHFSSPTCAILIERSACTFVVPASCADKARGLGVPESRLRIARPGEPFDVRLPGAQRALTVEPQRALHGHWHGSVYRHANVEDCGYLFTLGGVRFLQPGDTVLLHDHLELATVDVLFVSPTDHNMHVERSAILINTLEPEHIFPQHFGTYVETDGNRYWTKGYPDELKWVLPRPMRERFHKLAQGEIFVVQ
jgi:L-ascorbate metabolism protein UlaG (beta-lactamase superfamily)